MVKLENAEVVGWGMLFVECENDYLGCREIIISYNERS